MQTLQGLGHIHPSFCDVTPAAVAFFGSLVASDVLWAVGGDVVKLDVIDREKG